MIKQKGKIIIKNQYLFLIQRIKNKNRPMNKISMILAIQMIQMVVTFKNKKRKCLFAEFLKKYLLYYFLLDNLYISSGCQTHQSFSFLTTLMDWKYLV